MDSLNFSELQYQVGIWAQRNFGDQPTHRQVLGVCEEAGELAHATLKMEQGIRGTKEQHEADAKDAVGDITIYLADLCYRKGWSYQQIIEDTLRTVLKRDWKADPQGGKIPIGMPDGGKINVVDGEIVIEVKDGMKFRADDLDFQRPS